MNNEADTIKRMPGIYKIENLVNNKCYIGQASDLVHRKSQHFTDLKRNVHRSGHLQNAYNKYGSDNFIFKPILYCEPFELTRYEQAIVDTTCNIYNIRKLCVNSNKGIKYSGEFRLKNIERQKGEKSPMFGKHLSAEHRAKISKSHFGLKHTDASKKKISEVQIGKVHSTESNKKRSDALTGRPLSPEHKLAIGVARKGILHTEEAKAKMRESHKHITDETRQKMRLSKIGYHVSEETKRKISESSRGEKNHRYGKHLSEETKRKISLSNNGRGMSDENRKKASERMKEFWKIKLSETTQKEGNGNV